MCAFDKQYDDIQVRISAHVFLRIYVSLFVLHSDEAEDTANWNWLGANESIDVPTPTEKS